MLHGHDRERLVAFCKIVSSQRRLLAAETAVFAVHMELCHSTVIGENKFTIFVVCEQLAMEDM
jgi:hypothetical protein